MDNTPLTPTPQEEHQDQEVQNALQVPEEESGEEKKAQENPWGQTPAKSGAPKKKKSHFFLGLVVGILAGVLVCMGVLSAASGGVLNFSVIRKIGSLSGLIDNYYYNYNEADTSSSSKQESLYKGVLESLDDPYTVYYTADEYKELQQSLSGSYSGIGAYLGTDKTTGYPEIVKVMSDSPAEEAGLEDGDIIMKIDGESTDGMDLDTVVSKVHGEEGTSVTLTIARSTEAEYLEITVTRGTIEAEEVASKVLDNNIGYIAIAEFDTVTTDQFTEALQSLYDQNIEGLIIDLRDNPGGDVDVVTAIADEILPEGLVFYMKDVNGEETDYTCDGENEIQIPLVVLVNGNSASASEILTGAVQDAGCGVIVGTTTYGKGIVQTVGELPDGSAVKITTAAYFTRGGRSIQGTGITPDVEVELDAEAYLEDGTDTQLDKALEVVQGLVDGKTYPSALDEETSEASTESTTEE